MPNMLKWREDYYVGEGIKDAAKARKRIDAGRVAFGVYLVTLSENPGNLLEIVPSYMLIQKMRMRRWRKRGFALQSFCDGWQ